MTRSRSGIGWRVSAKGHPDGTWPGKKGQLRIRTVAVPDDRTASRARARGILHRHCRDRTRFPSMARSPGRCFGSSTGSPPWSARAIPLMILGVSAAFSLQAGTVEPRHGRAALPGGPFFRLDRVLSQGRAGLGHRHRRACWLPRRGGIPLGHDSRPAQGVPLGERVHYQSPAQFRGGAAERFFRDGHLAGSFDGRGNAFDLQHLRLRPIRKDHSRLFHPRGILYRDSVDRGPLVRDAAHLPGLPDQDPGEEPAVSQVRRRLPVRGPSSSQWAFRDACRALQASWKSMG